jgi:Cu/Ag efflux protein CusF
LIFGAALLALTPEGRAAEPCCGITGIDARTATVTAKETATGRSFTFKVPNAALLKNLKIGQTVYANFATSQVSVDGAVPCCSIVAVSSAAAKPAEPCCTITQIDLRTGLAVAKETATGRTFSFKVTDNNLLRSLKVGQAVYANFGSKQVSVNGVAPCCGIVGGPA